MVDSIFINDISIDLHLRFVYQCVNTGTLFNIQFSMDCEIARQMRSSFLRFAFSRLMVSKYHGTAGLIVIIRDFSGACLSSNDRKVV